MEEYKRYLIYEPYETIEEQEEAEERINGRWKWSNSDIKKSYDIIQ